MTRDDIELWFEKNVPEAIEMLPNSTRSVNQWVKALALILVKIAKEEAEEAEESSTDTDPIEDELDDDDSDDEEEEDDE
jgi:hypothetical protein